MSPGRSLREIESEIDNAHARAQRAYMEKDIEAYMALFSMDLAYRQANGKTIGHRQLRGDVAAQFSRVARVASSFRREALDVQGDCVVETLTQVATAEERLFFVFKRVWRVERRGRYTWVPSESGWVISSVEVIAECVE